MANDIDNSFGLMLVVVSSEDVPSNISSLDEWYSDYYHLIDAQDDNGRHSPDEQIKDESSDLKTD